MGPSLVDHTSGWCQPPCPLVTEIERAKRFQAALVKSISARHVLGGGVLPGLGFGCMSEPTSSAGSTTWRGEPFRRFRLDRLLYVLRGSPALEAQPLPI